MTHPKPVSESCGDPRQGELVTLLIVTYNQERFVGEALRGALAQSYQPLEIVIADDASTDATLAVVREAIDVYRGPHQVRIAPAAGNVGLFANIQRGCAASRGALVVLGAGDDVALPHRVAAMAAAWRRTDAIGLHSRYEEMDEAGVPTGREGVARAPGHALWRYLADKRDRAFVGGATSAYDRAFLDTLPATSERIFHEDSMLTLAIHAVGGRIEEVDEVTVRYRVHGGSYSNRRHDSSTTAGIVAQERDLAHYARDGRAYLGYLRHCWLPRAVAAEPAVARRLDLPAIDAALDRMERQGGWIEAGPVRRLALLLGARNRAGLRFALPRLFGLAAFARLRATAARLAASGDVAGRGAAR